MFHYLHNKVFNPDMIAFLIVHASHNFKRNLIQTLDCRQTKLACILYHFFQNI